MPERFQASADLGGSNGFRMKVEDMFVVLVRRHVFAGQLDTQAKIIADASCVIEIDWRAVR